MQNQAGGDAVHFAFAFVTGEFFLIQQLAGLPTSEALIVEVDWNTERVLEQLGELFGFQCLCTGSPPETEWMAYDEFLHIIFFYNLGEMSKVFTAGTSYQRIEPLGGNAERVRDRQTDTPRTEIERQDALVCNPVHVFVWHHVIIELEQRRDT